MSYLDTRDLETEREDLKQQVLESFLENFPHYEDMTDTFEDILFEEEEIQSWKEDWLDEITDICAIEDLEDEVGSEFSYGVTLIPEDDFEDFCEDLVSDIGDLPKDLPSYISNNIDWAGVAEDLRVDYSEVEFRGETYLFS
jgi:antirestriction protein